MYLLYSYNSEQTLLLEPRESSERHSAERHSAESHNDHEEWQQAESL